MDLWEALVELFRRYVQEIDYTATRWYFLVSSLVLAALAYLYHYGKSRGWSVVRFVRYLFPKALYTHRSTKNDLTYLLSFPIIGGVLFKPALAFSTAALTYGLTSKALSVVSPGMAVSLPESRWILIALTVAFTTLSAMAADLMFYFHHYLLHKVRFLWEFHKVHHSAEVLTPLTDFRAHPLELLTYGTASGIGVGLVQGVFNHFTGGQVGMYTVLGLNAIVFVYYVMGYPLRHSHVWISYGPILSRIFISPAQHQVHHSRARKHWDKNMGGTFALWDWIFGTLYIPREREDLEFGLSTKREQAEFQTVRQFYVQPFQNNARRSRPGLVLVLVILAVFAIFAIDRLWRAYQNWST